MTDSDAELKKLYEQLGAMACASAAATRMLKKNRSAIAFRTLRELDEKVNVILARINAILD